MGSSIAKRTATAVVEKPIAEVVVEIRRQLLDADRAEVSRNQHRLAAAQLLLRLRQRIEAGEEGAVDWWEWCAVNIERSRKDCERLLRFASAEDPEAALEADNAKARDRMREVRANVRSITRHRDGLCGSGDFVTVLEEVEPEALERPRKRRTDAEIERDNLRDRLLKLICLLRDGWPVVDLGEGPLPLSAEEIGDLIEAAETKITELEKLVRTAKRDVAKRRKGANS